MRMGYIISPVTQNVICFRLAGEYVKIDEREENKIGMRTSENDLSWQFVYRSFQWQETQKNAAHSRGQFHKLRFNIMLRVISINSLY